MTIRDAQKEEALHELAVDLVLEEGQVAVIGCRPENQQSLGTFLFSQPAAENEERHQRLVLIWASRNMNGVIAEPPRAAIAPSCSDALVVAPDEPPADPGPARPGPAADPPPPTRRRSHRRPRPDRSAASGQ